MIKKPLLALKNVLNIDTMLDIENLGESFTREVLRHPDKKVLKRMLLEKEVIYFFSKYYITGMIKYTSFEQFNYDIKNNHELSKLKNRCKKFISSVEDGNYKLRNLLESTQKDMPSIMSILMDIFLMKFDIEEVTKQNVVLCSILNDVEYDIPVEDLTYLALSVLSVGVYGLDLTDGEPFKTLIAKIKKSNVSSYSELDTDCQQYIKNACHKNKITLYAFLSIKFPYLVHSLPDDIELDFVLKLFFDLYEKEYFLTLMLPKLHKALVNKCEELGMVTEVYLENLGIKLVPETERAKLMKFIVGDVQDYFILGKKRLDMIKKADIYIASSDCYYQELNRKCRKLGTSLDDYLQSLGYNRIKKSELPKGFKYYFTPSTKSMDDVLSKVQPIIKTRVNSDGNVFLAAGTEDYNTVDSEARRINTTVDCLIHKCGYPRFFASGRVLYPDGHEEILASIYKKRDLSKESSIITLEDVICVKKILDDKEYQQFSNKLFKALNLEVDKDDDRLYMLDGTHLSKYPEEFKISKGEFILMSLILGFDIVYEENNDLILIEATENPFDILSILEIKLNKSIIIAKRKREIITKSSRYHSGYHDSRKFIESLFNDNGQIILSKDNYEYIRNLEEKYNKTIFELKSFFKESSFRLGQNKLDKPMSVEEIIKINADVNPSRQLKTTEEYVRNPHLVRQLKKLYDYKCQLCGEENNNIPILKDKYGTPYVEVHHIEHLSSQNKTNKNLDIAENCIVVCPYHHKMLHLRFENGASLISGLNGTFIFDIEEDVYRDDIEDISIKIETNKHLCWEAL